MKKSNTIEAVVLVLPPPMIEKYPLDRLVEAYGQMHSGKVRFRFVLAFNE